MTPAALDATFTALSDPTRRAILARLALGDATVGELAEPFAMTQPAISKHIKMLERAGLVSRSRDATRRPVHLEPAPMAEAAGFLDAFRQLWEANYARLDQLLAARSGLEQAMSDIRSAVSDARRVATQ